MYTTAKSILQCRETRAELGKYFHYFHWLAKTNNNKKINTVIIFYA